jgi:hypothetical protein
VAPLREKRKRERAPRARFPLALIGLVKELRFKGSKIFAKIDRKSSGKIFAKIEWKDTSKNPTGSKNNSLSE